MLLAWRPRPLLGLASGAALMVGLGLVASASGGDAAAGVPPAATATAQVPRGRMPALVCSPGASSRVAARPQGVAALRPTQSASSPATPTYTEQDVRSYLIDHPIPDQDPAGPPPPLRRSSSCPAARWPPGLNTRADEPVEALLCLVTWQGTFLGSAPAGLRGRNYALGYQVFDAYTGNLLIVGLQDERADHEHADSHPLPSAVPAAGVPLGG